MESVTRELATGDQNVTPIARDRQRVKLRMQFNHIKIHTYGKFPENSPSKNLTRPDDEAAPHPALPYECITCVIKHVFFKFYKFDKWCLSEHKELRHYKSRVIRHFIIGNTLLTGIHHKLNYTHVIYYTKRWRMCERVLRRKFLIMCALSAGECETILLLGEF